MAADDKTFTADELADEVKKAVEAALEQANARIAELEDGVEKTAIDTAVAEATAELRQQLDDARKEVETADAAKVEAENKLTETVDYLKAEHETATFETRRDERAGFVKELAIFSDELVEKSKDRWAAMDDETWEAQKEQYQEVADRKGIRPQPLPKKDARPTALTATADDEGGDRGTSAVREVMELTRSGVNTRTITVN